MSKIVFNYGVMNSSKSAQLLMLLHMYKEKGMKPLLIKPSIDDRNGVTTVSSRVGLSAEADLNIQDTLTFSMLSYMFSKREYNKAILVDEAQFLSPEIVHIIASYARLNDLSVFAYGLSKTFQNELFEGSGAWIEEADTLNEIKTTCSVPGCERKASRNLRLSDGKAVYSGDTIQIGGEESYTGVCAKHWINYPSNL